MDEKEKLIRYMDEFIRRRIHAYDLGLRAKRGLSSASAYRTKMCVNLINQLSKEDIEELKEIEKYSMYIRKFVELSEGLKAKEVAKNIDKSDKFSSIIEKLKKEIQPLIVEQQEKIEKSIRSNWKRLKDEYKELGNDGFTEKYGTTITRYNGSTYKSLSRFTNSYPGSLLHMSENALERFIQMNKDSYRDKEHSKIHRLITRLNERQPSIDNIKLVNTKRSVNGIEFMLTADSDHGKLFIETHTIYAGGYNIQRLHLRWLMNVIDKSTGKTITSIRGN